MSETGFQEDDHLRRLDLSLWRRMLPFARPYRTAILGLAVAGLLVAATDVLLPRITGLVIDAATRPGQEQSVQRYAVQYLGLIAVAAVLVWGFIVLAGRVATGVAYAMRRQGFAHLQELSFSFYDRRPTGWLVARLSSDCQRPADLVPWFLLDLCWGTALILGISGMMVALHRELALCILVTAPPLALLCVIFQQKLLRSQRAMRKTNSLITAGFQEGIAGVRTTKTLVREEASLEEFRGLSSEMFRHSLRNSVQSALFLPVVLSLGSVGTGLALWRGGVQTGHGLSLGTLITFMQYAAFFYIPIQELAGRFTDLQSVQAAFERVIGLLDSKPEVEDAPEVRAASRKRRERGERLRSIRFEQVSFAYVPGKEVLSDFDLRVTAGDTIALVGPTGSGKTTVVNLLCRFYEPTGGRILINGEEYKSLGLEWLHSKLGIVLQQPHLFGGTIRENIRYGRLTATDQEVAEAARLVQAEPFILRLEKGYDTEVGEGGGRLSTGQKQLISLARAVLADPEIFILDEATSSVDPETEHLIQEGIERVLRGRTSFIIAHRLSTVRRADRILVIDRGRLIEQGSHSELLRLNGAYARLYRNQFRSEREEEILEDQAAGAAVLLDSAAPRK